MSDQRRVGYCTNVHAGADLSQSRTNLQQHALAVKQQYCPDAPMGVGLWLSAAAARDLLAADEQLDEFAGWLGDSGLLPFTLNGFPYGDFHQPVVKHEVYEPTWGDQARLQYTLDLFTIHDRILPAGEQGSISTLPLFWGEPAPSCDQLTAAAANLRRAADALHKLEQDRGRLIRLCIEPEPGCAIQRSGDLVDFFEQHLLTAGNEEVVRRHICVCHDVCHAAVMFEPQRDVIERYATAGITVGKVQISSAVQIDFDALPDDQRRAAAEQLAAFAEDRYLHQTMVHDGGISTFHEDLPKLLADLGWRGPGEAWPASTDAPRGEWRIHFHVPVYLSQFGLLSATQSDILDCLRAASGNELVNPHFEVETYAWGVLPGELQQPVLADGIAEELRWFSQQL